MHLLTISTSSFPILYCRGLRLCDSNEIWLHTQWRTDCPQKQPNLFICRDSKRILTVAGEGTEVMYLKRMRRMTDHNCSHCFCRTFFLTFSHFLFFPSFNVPLFPFISRLSLDKLKRIHVYLLTHSMVQDIL